MKPTRRQLLQGLGTLAAGSALLPPRLSLAQAAGGPPLRTVIIQFEHAWVYEKTAMKPANAPAGFGQYASDDPAWGDKPDPDTFTLDLENHPENLWSPVLKPLYPYRKWLRVMDGVCSLSATMATDKGIGGLHGRMNTGMTTISEPLGTNSSGTVLPAGMSLDQVIARDILAKYPGYAGLDSVIYRAQGHYTPNTDYDWCFTKDSAGKIVVRAPQLFSDLAFSELFPTPPTPGKGPSPEAVARRSVLSFVHADYKATRDRMSGLDRERMGTHADLLSDIIKRLDVPLAAGCQPGTKPSRIQGSYEQIIDGMTSQHLRNIAAALSCGRTHVATLQLDWPKGGNFGFPEYDEGELHNELGHSDNPYQHTSGTYARCQEVLAAFDVWHLEKVIELLELLRTITDENGAPLLDTTQVVLMPQLLMGSHWPWHGIAITIGGSAALHTGVYQRFGRTVEAPWGPQGPDYWPSLSIERWGTTILQAAGVNVEHNGMPQKYGDILAWGPIPGALK